VNPSYAFRTEKGELRIWFANAGGEEHTNGCRYSVIYYPDEGGYVPMRECTNDIEQAIDFFRDARERLEAGEEFTEEGYFRKPQEWSPRKDS
jgi:hypothetical protein